MIAVPAGPLGSFPVQTLRPGSAVSAGYSSGDLRIGAIGTVAYTDAGRVWAFGHSFESAGARNLLLQDAYVFKVVNEPNAALTGGSYKLSAAGHDVGTLTNDAFAAIVGRVGALPHDDRRGDRRGRSRHRRDPVRADHGGRRDRRRHARPASPRSAPSRRWPSRRPPAACCAARPAA